MVRPPALALPSVLLLALLIGCGSGGPPEDEVLASLADLVIVPGYRATATEIARLDDALTALCATPSPSALDHARSAWRDARAPWMRSKATWFGPIMDRRSIGLMDWSPVEPERIEKLLRERPAATQETIRDELSSTQRGFGAVEYLLFADDALERLSDPSSPRCDYVAALGRSLRSECEAILADWEDGSESNPAYAEFFTGRSSSSLLTTVAVTELVRTQVFLIRAIVDMRLAAALGLREGGADYSAIPGGAADNGLADLQNEVLGLRDVYIGHDSPDALGISDTLSLTRPI